MSQRARQRKNDSQHNFLMHEFLKDPNWSKETIIRLSKIIGLKPNQIYKWKWDQLKKIKDGGSMTQLPSTLIVTSKGATLAL